MPAPDPSSARRAPKRLLLAFFGEFLLFEGVQRVRARAVIRALEGAGVKAPATRAALERMSRAGLVDRAKQGREVVYELTPLSKGILGDAMARVQSVRPFEPEGPGWSLVLFSLPDQPQPVRHQLRSILTWEGFAPYGRGAWIAPGRPDFDTLRAALARRLQSDAVIAFHADVADGFAITEAVHRVWDVPAIAQRHREFIRRWDPGTTPDITAGTSALSLRTMLSADWLDLLRTDPRLPRDHLPPDWPADRSYELVSQWRRRLVEPANRELREILDE